MGGRTGIAAILSKIYYTTLGITITKEVVYMDGEFIRTGRLFLNLTSSDVVRRARKDVVYRISGDNTSRNGDNTKWK